MFVSELQPLNARSPILVTPLGIVILVSEVQSENALYSILVSDRHTHYGQLQILFIF